MFIWGRNKLLSIELVGRKALKSKFLDFFMKVGILFSGGKDSVYAAYLAEQVGNELACAIVIKSKNPDSYMFHTPSIEKAEKQVELMDVPILIHETKGNEEKELKDLTEAIKIAKEKYGIEGIVTGALHSEYQASRIGKICDELGLESINPLWHKDEIEYLNELVDNDLDIVITAVAAYPLDGSWLGRKIDGKFIEEVKKLKEKYKIHPAGEGGEFETFVLSCPLFSRKLKIKSFEDFSTGENSWRREIEVE
jgi:diphthine-ammonia ligase